MACRKAAYNALTEMSEYMEKQAEHAALAKTRLETEQRRIWTPPMILDSCCIPWLSDGSEVVGHRTNHHVSKGCSGGCGKDHPRITLMFDDTIGSSAEISHPLDPFSQYFEELCDQGLASRVNIDGTTRTDEPRECSKHKRRIYRLNGFLNDHRERLRRSSCFGYHLVKVSPADMAASRRAHDRHVEQEDQLERYQKRRRLEGAPNHSNSQRNLLEGAMQICYDQGALLSNLDILDVAWMRLTGDRTLTKFAAKVASDRMRQLRLSYTALLLRTQNDDEGSKKNCFEDQSFINIRCGPFSLETLQERPGHFAPATSGQRIEWEHCGDAESLPSTVGPLVLRISVRLEGTDPISSTSLPGDAPEMDCLFDQPIEVGWYHIELPRDLSGEDSVPEGQMTIPSEQTSCSKVLVYVSSLGLSYRCGNLSLSSLSFDYRHLMGIYARRKLPLAKQEMMELKKKRPVTVAEKDYVRAVAKEARQAPGSGERTFVGLDGWPNPSSRGRPSFTRYDSLRVNAASALRR